MSRQVTRRLALVALAAGFAAARAARAGGAREKFALETPEGAVIRNFAIAPAFAPADLPGVLVAGAAKAGPVLYEFFDYACPYCRLASQELDLLLGPDSGLRHGLLHHPVLGGARSEEAALVVLATQRLFGDESALRLHARLFETPGRAGMEKALECARALALDPERLKAETGRAETRAVLDAHSARAVALGLRQTPAFVLGGYAFVGWPGPETIQTFVAALRQCGGLACPQAQP